MQLGKKFSRSSQHLLIQNTENQVLILLGQAELSFRGLRLL